MRNNFSGELRAISPKFPFSSIMNEFAYSLDSKKFHAVIVSCDLFLQQLSNVDKSYLNQV